MAQPKEDESDRAILHIAALMAALLFSGLDTRLLQVRDFLRGVYERAAWLPGKGDAKLSVLYASHK